MASIGCKLARPIGGLARLGGLVLSRAKEVS